MRYVNLPLLEDVIDALEMYGANIGGYTDSVVLKDIV